MNQTTAPALPIASLTLVDTAGAVEGSVVDLFDANGASLGRRFLPGVTDPAGIAAALAAGVNEPPPPMETLAARRARLKAAASARRWLAETGGIKVTALAGMEVATDDRSKSLVAAHAARARANPALTVGWKCADGSWRALTASQMIALDTAIGEHLNACFAKECEISAAIDTASTPAALSTLSESITNFAPAAPGSTLLPYRPGAQSQTP